MSYGFELEQRKADFIHCIPTQKMEEYLKDLRKKTTISEAPG